MSDTILSARSPLASCDNYQLVEMYEADIAALQIFYEANPEYNLIVAGKLPHATLAHEDFYELPPPEFPMTKKTIIGLVDPTGQLFGIADIVSDLFATDVWHIGFFMVASACHGGGLAGDFYQALEMWMARQGARWLRLGVVADNPRGKRFWQRCGYTKVRTRESFYQNAGRSHTLDVLVKPLAGNNLHDYLVLVATDRPE